MAITIATETVYELNGNETQSDRELSGSSKLNVLLIMVDDFRPETASYGSSNVVTPNMDAFAQSSVQFERAYVQQALCGPSRVSMLSSRLPTTTNYYIHTEAEEEYNALKTGIVLPKWFESNGYDTFGTSKIFHFGSNNKRYFGAYNKQPAQLENDCGNDVVCSDSDTLSDFTDYRALQWAKGKLNIFANAKRYKKKGVPWFLAVGFRRPHLIFRAPQFIYDRFNVDDVSIPDEVEQGRPDNSPWQAYSGMCYQLLTSNEVTQTSYTDPFTQILDDSTTRELRMGYFACVEWIDYAVGELLNHLDAKGLTSKTLVVLTSDHGWSLGEKTSWCKGTVEERALRIPLWIRDPTDTSNSGTQVQSGISLMDVFPTVAELAGVPLGLDEYVKYGVEGNSFANLVRGTDDIPENVAETLLRLPQLGGHPWSYPKNATFSVWPICVDSDAPTEPVPCHVCVRESDNKKVDCETCSDQGWDCTKSQAEILYMGMSVRTDRFRYSEWRPYQNSANIVNWTVTEQDVERRELFDHDTTLGSVEMENVADSEDYADNVDDLSAMLKARFVPCKGKGADDEETCLARGNHCVYYKSSCINRGFCDFGGSDAATDCDAREEACVWSPIYGRCVNKIVEGRSVPTGAEVGARPGGTPTNAPTSAPTSSPTLSRSTCSEFSESECTLDGCNFFTGIGCRETSYCDFTRKRSSSRRAGCLSNKSYCKWQSRRCKSK